VKLFKRLLAVGAVLCLAMVLVIPSIALSLGDVAVSIDAPAEVGEGGDFIARVNITDVANFDAANYDIAYDPLILEVTDVTDGLVGETLISVDMWDSVPSGTQAMIRVIQNVPGLSGVSGSGYLAEIHFHVAGSAGKASNITPSNGVLSDNTASEIPTTWVGDSVRVPGSRSGGGGGGGGSKPTPKPNLDVMSEVCSVPMTKDGVLEEALKATSSDGAVTLSFAQGTQMLDSEGDPLEKITVDPISDLQEPPESAHIIGLAYDFGPEGATFDPEMELTISYDAESLPEGVNEEDIIIVYYNSDSGEFLPLSSVVDTESHTVTVSIGHFSVFAVIGWEEACFDFVNLSISPTTVDPGEIVTINAELTNLGGLEGSYTIKLLIDDIEEATHELVVAPGGTDTATFTVTREDSGTYTVEIDGLEGEFTVRASLFPWALLAGILGASTAAGITAAVLIRSRRKAASLSEG
jgi:hypothetical protein